MAMRSVDSRRRDPSGPAPTAERLRALCWELGTRYPPHLHGDRLVLATVHPHLAFLHWHLEEASVDGLQKLEGQAFDGARMALRVYDVTAASNGRPPGSAFAGDLATHGFFDINVSGLRGTHYHHIAEVDRDFVAEVGFALPSGKFCPMARTRVCRFDLDRASGRFSLRGLYVGEGHRRVFPVENVLDAPVYERLAEDMARVERQSPIHVALLHLGMADRLSRLLGRFVERAPALGLGTRLFAQELPADEGAGVDDVVDAAEARSEGLLRALLEAHEEEHFELLHAHDWCSLPAALEAAERLDLPLLLSLHSTEVERAGGAQGAERIRTWEQRGLDAAELVLVPHSSSRQQLLQRYRVDEERIQIVPDVYDEEPAIPDPGAHKRHLGLHPAWPVALFAGEISRAAGADLLVDAMLTVCHEHGEAQFVFAGEGPLRQELEGRVHGAGLGHRCRFLGDVGGEAFDGVLLAADFVVIPARTWQDEGLAKLATSYGKPVLTTHQAQIHCVAHGESGLVTYDNPGSIVWGVKELLHNPLQGNMLRLVARETAQRGQSFESSVAEHYLAYARALARWEA